MTSSEILSFLHDVKRIQKQKSIITMVKNKGKVLEGIHTKTYRLRKKKDILVMLFVLQETKNSYLLI